MTGQQCVKPQFSETVAISIHAPAQGATLSSDALPFWGNFNPRPRAGGDSKTNLHSHVHLIIFTQVTPFPCIFLFGIIQIHAKTSFSIGANATVFS